MKKEPKRTYRNRKRTAVQLKNPFQQLHSRIQQLKIMSGPALAEKLSDISQTKVSPAILDHAKWSPPKPMVLSGAILSRQYGWLDLEQQFLALAGELLGTDENALTPMGNDEEIAVRITLELFRLNPEDYPIGAGFRAALQGFHQALRAVQDHSKQSENLKVN